MKKFVFLAFALIGAVLAGCDDNGGDPKPSELTITSDLSFTQVNEIKYSDLAMFLPVNNTRADLPASQAPFSIVVKADEGLTSLSLKLTTDNAAINGALTEMGFAGTFDLATLTGDQAAAMEGFGFPTGSKVAGAKNVGFSLVAFMPMIYTVPGGINQFDVTITAKDAKNVTKTETAKMKFVDDLEYVFITGADEPIEITPAEALGGIEVVVGINAPLTIENLIVEISSTSQAFTAGLAVMHLDTAIDLANPGPLADVLTPIGLPNGDAVKGKSAVNFDISEFIPMLYGIAAGAGETEFSATFSLTVKDPAGHELTKDLELNFVAAE